MEKTIKQRVRELRKNATKSEVIFWEFVRNRKVNGKKFIRQYPVTFVLDGMRKLFILDFYCSEYKLGIELDGKIHEKQQDYDKLREYIINNFGINIVRYNNEEIETNIANIIKQLEEALKH